MAKKARFNDESADRSYLLHEFLTIYKDFSETLSQNSGLRMLHFLQDQDKYKSFIAHALFNPHPETHDSVENDIENTIVALNSWMDGKVNVEVPYDYLLDLKKWLMKD